MNRRFADSHLHLLHTDPADVIEMLDSIAAAGVTDGTLLAVCPMEEYGVLQNYLCLWWKAHYPKLRLRAFGSLHEANDRYGAIPYEDQLEGLLALGCDGVKFIHMKPDMRKQIGKGIDHPSYDGVFAMMEERDLPVTVHCADPRTFWDPVLADPRDIARGWFYGDGTFPTYESLYGEIWRRLEKNPRLRISFAHFFFLSDDLEEAARVMETYPNLRFDLTPGREMYVNFSRKIDAWQEFFDTYSHRILFGTDSEDLRCSQKIRFVEKAVSHGKTEFQDPLFGITVKGLGLSAEAVERIRYGNYLDFVGPDPVPVNGELLRRAEECLCRDFSESSPEGILLKKMKAVL